MESATEEDKKRRWAEAITKHLGRLKNWAAVSQDRAEHGGGLHSAETRWLLIMMMMNKGINGDHYHYELYDGYHQHIASKVQSYARQEGRRRLKIFPSRQQSKCTLLEVSLEQVKVLQGK